ncbi:MAG: hypothetical protein WC107_07705 [Patescibacteria group bacterium]
MQGSSSLSGYAGQTITCSGVGALLANNCAALLSGDGSLSATARVPASCLLSGTATVTVYTTQAAAAFATLPAIVGLSGDYAYSVANAALPALTEYADGGLYVPAVPVGAVGDLPALWSVGMIVQSNPGDATGTLPTIDSLAGDYAFGVGSANLPVPESFGMPGDEFEAYVLSYGVLVDGMPVTLDTVIILTSEGTLAASFAADRIAVTQFLSDITGESSFASTVELLTSLLSSGGFTDSLSAAVGDRAAVDGQVWVVNLATEASSQYDDFGFNSFFTHEGRHYGVASDGIYLLEGTTDNGEVIESMVDFGINDCGLPHRKKILNVRIGTTDGADTVLEVTTDTGTREYKLERSKEGDFFWRARMPHIQQGVYWRFVLKSSTQFELNSIDFAPANLTRRF